MAKQTKGRAVQAVEAAAKGLPDSIPITEVETLELRLTAEQEVRIGMHLDQVRKEAALVANERRRVLTQIATRAKIALKDLESYDAQLKERLLTLRRDPDPAPAPAPPTPNAAESH